MKRTIVNPAFKDTCTFINTSRETNGKASNLELTLEPSEGNFMHYHKTFTETFTAIDGELGLRLAGNKTKILKPNESYAVPPNQLHSFFNPGKTGIKFKIDITPGHEGFENSLKIVYGLAEDGLTDSKGTPKSFTHIAVLAKLSDSNLSGIFMLLGPVLKFVARRAEKSGLEKELINKYCI